MIRKLNLGIDISFMRIIHLFLADLILRSLLLRFISRCLRIGTCNGSTRGVCLWGEVSVLAFVR